MAASLDTKQRFIELRANNVSYEKIAIELKVSKTTLIAWARDCELDINNLRAIAHEAFMERLKIGQHHRLQMWAEQLEEVRAELKRRGLSDLPTAKLLELIDTLNEKLSVEAYEILFKSEKVEKPFEFEPLTTSEQDTWHG